MATGLPFRPRVFPRARARMVTTPWIGNLTAYNLDDTVLPIMERVWGCVNRFIVRDTDSAPKVRQKDPRIRRCGGSQGGVCP